MNKLEIMLSDSNNDGNLRYRYIVLDPNGRIILMTSNLYTAEMYLKK